LLLTGLYIGQKVRVFNVWVQCASTRFLFA